MNFLYVHELAVHFYFGGIVLLTHTTSALSVSLDVAQRVRDDLSLLCSRAAAYAKELITNAHPTCNRFTVLNQCMYKSDL